MQFLPRPVGDDEPLKDEGLVSKPARVLPRRNEMTDKAPELNPPPQPNGTLFECKLDHSNCDHEWLPENGNPEYCGKCGTSLMAYAFMECP